MAEEKSNPYESPNAPPVTTKSSIGSTILVFVLSILSVLAGVIVFFVVCFGTGLAGVSFVDKGGGASFPTPEFIVVIAFLFGGTCGIGTIFFLGRWIYRSRLKINEKREAADAAKQMSDP